MAASAVPCDRTSPTRCTVCCAGVPTANFRLSNCRACLPARACRILRSSSTSSVPSASIICCWKWRTRKSWHCPMAVSAAPCGRISPTRCTVCCAGARAVNCRHSSAWCWRPAASRSRAPSSTRCRPMRSWSRRCRCTPWLPPSIRWPVQRHWTASPRPPRRPPAPTGCCSPRPTLPRHRPCCCSGSRR